MKLELCSGFKIYPGHGRTLVKADGKTYKFLSAKTQKSHDLKRNPRKITWTVLYRLEVSHTHYLRLNFTHISLGYQLSILLCGYNKAFKLLSVHFNQQYDRLLHSAGMFKFK